MIKQTRILERKHLGLVILFVSTYVALFSLLNPVWFTNSKHSVDPWIYWGAGDEPRLSFQNDFARTYYLQRYVVILPKIIAFQVFGSFWGQLVVAWIWILITSTFLFKVASRFISIGASIALVIVLLSDPVIMGSFGSSYTMASTIGLYSILLYLLTSDVSEFTERKKKIFIFFIGTVLTLLLNAYMTHGISAMCLVACYVLIHRKRLGWQFLWGISLVNVSLNLLIQTFYFALSSDPIPVVIRQLWFGINLATSPNPYGSNGFLDFWMNVWKTELSYYWLTMMFVGIVSILICFFIKFDKSKELEKVNLFATLLFLSYFAQTFFHSNIVGYAWSACAMYILKFIALLTLIITFSRNKLQNMAATVLCFGSVVSLFAVYRSEVLLEAEFVRNGMFAISAGAVLLGLLLATSRIVFKKFILNHIGLLYFLLIFTLMMFHVLPIFRQFAVPYEASFSETRRAYDLLSKQREVSLLVSNSLNPKPRIWFTPDSGTPLVSSQLFLYSLISNEIGKANCSQVRWAANYNSIIMSFATSSATTTDVNKFYLNECGYRAVEITLSETLATELELVGGKVWALRKEK